MPILTVENVTKKFGGFEALKGVSLTVEEGETVAIIGSSGSGKSTLLRCVNALEKVSGGRIVLDGETVVQTVGGKAVYPPEKELRRICLKTGMVFQQFDLFPHLTCLENITIAPIRILKRPRTEAADTARRLLKLVGLEDKAGSYPAMLSGGQQQRVAIARALAIRPRLMLFDEPTSALDPELTAEVTAVIAELARQNTTMLIVTHEMEFARTVADRILFFEDGRITAQGAANEFFAEQKNERVRRFLSGFQK
ncbi:amino acid ABC transporter ATP-binding protein [Acidaminobacterium chupaoyuni]